ncbi:MAG: DJ-1 family glyoxalase III [Acutalibacteraceae bacterium]
MIYVFLADGFEEVEALTPVDILRRAEIAVSTVGIGSKRISGSHGIDIICDFEADEVKPNSDLVGIILPGGMPGTKNLGNSSTVHDFIDYAAQNHLLIAAICAAPSILGRKGLLEGKRAVCFPSFEKDLINATIAYGYVCIDDNYITAKGAGASVDFALAIVAYFKGEREARKLRESIQCP